MSNIICFDTETTGIDPRVGDEMLSLAIIDGDGNELFNKRFRPTNKKNLEFGWPEAEKINHISLKDVITLPTFEHYRDEVQKIFDDADEIVGFNTAFDIKMVKAGKIKLPDMDYAQALTKCDRKHGKPLVVHDVMRMYSDTFGGKWPKLVALAEKYRYNWQGDAHDALFDTKATLYCFEKLQEEIKNANSVLRGTQLHF